MKVLLLAKTQQTHRSYIDVHLNILQQAFAGQHYTIEDKLLKNQTRLEKIKELNLQEFDAVIGIGDSYFTIKKFDMSIFKGIPTIEFSGTGDSRQKKKSIADFIFSRIPGELDTKAFYVGNTFPEDHLYVEDRKTDQITVWVDHAIGYNNDKTVEILRHLESVQQNYPVRVLHQGKYGIGQNLFTSQCSKGNMGYNTFDYDIITSLYRKADVFLPTHKESIGMLAGEIGLCGGITLLESYMYPEQIKKQFQYIQYKNLSDIDWNSIRKYITTEKRHQRRKYCLEHYGMESFKQRCLDAVSKITKGKTK